jgi:purine-binding chemotaxis protein CheW
MFQIRGGLYAVGSEYVREIVSLPQVVAIPGVPPEVRGVINLRGKVMQLIDLRVKLGMPAAKAETEELIQLLRDREKDHQNWLTELEGCVREHRPFKLARDPHACKFGQWYDQFQTEHSLLRMALKKMDEPHQAIHATADEALQRAEKGDEAGAMALLSSRRQGELAKLVKLFEETRQLICENQRELAVVLGARDERLAISIDRIESVERIPEENIEAMPATMAGASDCRWRIAKRTKTNQTILLLNGAEWFGAKSVQARERQ